MIRIVIAIMLVSLILFSCGKKNDPEFKSTNLKIINLI